MRNESEYIVILRGEKDLMKKDQGKMSLGARLAYSFGAFGNDSFYGLLSGYLIMFITSHLFNTGNQAEDAKMISIVTLIIMGLRIVELFIDPFIGNAIDRTKTRWGSFPSMGCSWWFNFCGNFIDALHQLGRFVSKERSYVYDRFRSLIHHYGYLLFIQRRWLLVNASIINY